METIRVNMTPCEDIKTIHASQNDNEAREWGFELHNNGEKIDSSSISDQLVFKAYEGGTEQILPENTSTPTTSPFLGDIKYPQGLLTDQEFTYRQSPTEEDGLAKITDIKGNTLVWNQLVQNGNFADTSEWYARDGATLTVSNNVGTLVTTSANISAIMCRFSYVQGHKYLIKLSAKSSSGQTLGVGLTNNNGTVRNPWTNINATSSWQDYYVIGTANSAPSGIVLNDGLVIRNNNSAAQTVELKNVQVFDLTQMGLDISNPSDFTSLFPLSYYAYNQGTLLSFMGNGIKTVGKNLFTGAESYSRETAGYYIREGETNNPLPLKLAKGTYTISIKSTVEGRSQLELFSGGIATSDRFLAPYISLVVGVKTYTFTIDKQSDYIRLYGNFVGTLSDIQIEFGSTATDYEPYTSSTLSLPISTYFPNGMDGVGTDYDELTNTKATTRMTRVDLGSLDWNYNPTYGMYSTGISNSVKKPSASSVRANAISTIGTFTDWATFYASGTTSGLLAINTSGYIGIATTETNSTTFKNSLQGVYLVYPLATPIETSFTIASLVTENGEIPLSNEDGVLIGKCTEQLSSESGFFDAKIKLADEDGECYSNKLQLHIERSPQ